MRIRVIAGIVLTCSILAQKARSQAPGRPGSPALDFHARTLGASPTSRTFADYRGSVTILTIWATWCRDCHDELASLQRLYATYHDRGLRVVAISIDRGTGDAGISEYVRKLGITFDVLRDEDNEILDTYFVRGPPSVFVIDRDGIIRRRNVSAVDWDVDPRLAQITELLAEPAPKR